MEFAMYVIYAVLLLLLGLSVYFSFKYRRQNDTALRGVYNAKMNICLGALLVLLAFIQLFAFALSYVRLGVGVVFFLLGLFNLFSGIRNHMFFSKRLR
ncbi:MAG TPA: YtpI family protein [Bacilli bacterium]